MDKESKVKIFVSTTETQGQRDNDFCFVPEGELVYTHPWSVCDTSRRLGPDDSCGCARSMDGTATMKGTTTFRVVEMAWSLDQYVSAIQHAMKKAGWLERLEQLVDQPDIAQEVTNDMIDIASNFPVGTILERRGPYRICRRRI